MLGRREVGEAVREGVAGGVLVRRAALGAPVGNSLLGGAARPFMPPHQPPSRRAGGGDGPCRRVTAERPVPARPHRPRASPPRRGRSPYPRRRRQRRAPSERAARRGKPPATPPPRAGNDTRPVPRPPARRASGRRPRHARPRPIPVRGDAHTPVAGVVCAAAGRDEGRMDGGKGSQRQWAGGGKGRAAAAGCTGAAGDRGGELEGQQWRQR